ncbi:MAG: protein-tyrosine phosphatase [Yoonia sp.]|jgi:protein-tyrosine phosphatase
MDAQNQFDIEKQRPKGNATPVRMLADTGIPDPYYTVTLTGPWT